MEQAVICFLCNGDHLTNACAFPQMIRRCSHCQLPIFNYQEHICDAHDIPKSFYTDIIAKKTLALFRFAYKGEIYFLSEKHQFHRMSDGQALICGTTDGMFTITKCDGFSRMEYSAISVKKFSFLIAILQDKHWQIWLRAVVSKSHGLQLFNMDHERSPYPILPPKFNLNTSAVFAVIPDAGTAQMDFTVYANSNGNIDYDAFNGYGGNVTWPRSSPDLVEVNSSIEYFE